jgi:SAM-dependent methyltransferase
MIETIEYKNNKYPKFQDEGYASQFAIPFANNMCRGKGVDVGCNRIEWMFGAKALQEFSKEDFPERLIKDYGYWSNFIENNKNSVNSFPIDPNINEFDALNFPDGCENLDYVFSSHCLEHLYNWVDVLDYWDSKLKSGGVMFLYLPDYSQVYWRPWNNKKHLNIFNSTIIEDYLLDRGYSNIFKSGVDLNNAFMVVAEKK